MSKKKNIVKKQHYVPRVYLKNFCERNKTTNVFDKEQLRHFKANINDIACENYFYDFDIGSKENEQIVEKILGEFESSYGSAINSVLEKLDSLSIEEVQNEGKITSLSITIEEKESLALFFSLQMYRTKKQRIIYSQIFKSIAEKVAELSLQEKVNIVTYEDKFTPVQVKHLLESLPFATRYLAKQKWFFHINTSSRPFYTSDNPAILDSQFCARDGRGKGLVSPGMNFYLPLSSKYLLFIVENSLLKNYKSMLNYSNIVAVINDEEVLYANDLQLNKSLFQVYASSAAYFNSDKEFCIEKDIDGDKNRCLINK